MPTGLKHTHIKFQKVTKFRWSLMKTEKIMRISKFYSAISENELNKDHCKTTKKMRITNFCKAMDGT